MRIITVPSWVIPGTYLENLCFLAPKPEITGVELLFFFYNQETRALLEQEWAGIAGYASRFVFTAHLPDTLAPEHGALVERLLPLVRHCVLHPGKKPFTQAQLINTWLDRFGPDRFVLENTYPEKLDAILSLLPPETKICMDCGHLLLENERPCRFFTRHRERIREIHLHGIDRERAVADGRLADHRPLREDAPWYRELAPCLKDFDGIVNLEVFSWEEVSQSLGVLGT